MSEEIRAHFRNQGEACRRLGSPFTASLLEMLAGCLDESSEFGRRILTWPGDPRDDALALRAAGALQALARSGRSPGLSSAWPPGSGPAPDERLVMRAIGAHSGWLLPWLESAPQTNEVARSGVLIGGLMAIAHETGKPLELLEIGASAGLNLIPDFYRYDFGGREWGAADAPLIRTTWRGAPAPEGVTPQITARAGVDLRPIDPEARPSPLLPYIWADQEERRERCRAALARLATTEFRVETGDAAEWLEERLAREQADGHVRVVMHSIMWSYLPAALRERISAQIKAAGASADESRPFAHLAFEHEEELAEPAVHLTIWPGGERKKLGVASAHGQWAEWG